MDFKTRLQQRLNEYGIEAVSESGQEALSAYFSVLSHWNQRINLTGFDLSAPNDTAFDRLIIEPIFAARRYGQQPQRMIDIGSGGGSPGIPLAIVTEAKFVALVESKSRKAVFLKEALRASGIQNAEVLVERFEEVAKSSTLAKSFDIATLRAVKLDASGWQSIAALLKPDGAFLHIGDRGEATEPSLHKIGTWSLQALGPVSLYGG